MQIRLRKKWQVVFGICILLLGLMLIRYTDKSREVVPPQEDFDSSIFDVDEEMRAIGLGEFKQHSAPLIEKALSAILAKRMLEPKLVRRVLTTDTSDHTQLRSHLESLSASPANIISLKVGKLAVSISRYRRNQKSLSKSPFL